MLTITQLVIVSLLVGLARVFFDVGYQSYIPSVIGKERVLAGNSSMETIRASGQVVGPGLSVVGRNKILRAVMIASAVVNFSFAMASAVSFIFMSRTLALSAAEIGLIIAASSVTIMVGAAFTPRFSRLLGSARIIWVSLAVTGPVVLLGAIVGGTLGEAVGPRGALWVSWISSWACLHLSVIRRAGRLRPVGNLAVMRLGLHHLLDRQMNIG